MDVEFGPGVAIPIGDFLVTEGSNFSEHVDSTVGFGGQLNLLLDDWEFRYAFSILPTNEVRTSISPAFKQKYNQTAQTINQSFGGIEVLPLEPNPNVPTENVASGEAITIHHINGGYRFYYYRQALAVYTPLGLGLALTTGPDTMLSRTLYGLSANTGVGVDYRVLKWLRVGGSIRYLFTISESAGDVTLANVVANLGFSKEDLGTTFHLGHMIHIAANIMASF